MTPETWPVVASPATGHPDRCPICWSPVDGNQCHLHQRADIDVNEALTVIRRHLVWPAPIPDKALMEE